MKRRTFLRRSATAALGIPGLVFVGRGAAASPPAGKTWTQAQAERFGGAEELSISDLQALQTNGRLSAVSIARKYLERIERRDRQGPGLRSVIELNPDALDGARALDRERKAGRVRGPLHGIPVLLKDNIDTHDRMTCTAGSLALLGSHPPKDAFLVQKLREAGAVILGKANLSEWANFRGSRSTSGWSGRGGLTRNPYVLDRNPSGSSSGSAVAVAANLCSVAVGTETNGSIVSPASFCGVVGIKPTVGLISRAGIIPIAKSQDTAGPLARTVKDAAILLSAMAFFDPQDPAGNAGLDRPGDLPATFDYTRALDAGGLRGIRIGIARRFFHGHPAVRAVQEAAVKDLLKAGAVLIDPIEMPKLASSYEVMVYEFKTGLNDYFASLGPGTPVRSLKELIEFNERHRQEELRWFGQEILVEAEAKGPLTETKYLEAVAACRRSSRKEGVDALMNEHRLDAIMAPTTGPAHVTDFVYGDRDTGGSSSPAAVAGYPSITLPGGFVQGLPIGISFFGRAWSEAALLKIAYAFEQETQHRHPPHFLSTVVSAGL